MSSIVALAGSPSAGSRTVALVEHVAGWLRADDHEVLVAPVRALPAASLLCADAGEPNIAAVVAEVADADGIVVASPVYKAAYSGVLKAFLDLLPRSAFAGKAVLPLLTGGTPGHALAVDYALRPVLAALGARHVVPGLFVLDKHIERTPAGVVLDMEAEAAIQTAVTAFTAALPVGVRR